MTPSPADLRKLADRFVPLFGATTGIRLTPDEMNTAAECIRERAAEIEREAYRVKQAAIEAREPKPLHTGREM